MNKTKTLDVYSKPLKETKEVLIFKASKALTVSAFEAAAKMLRSEQEASGLTIILIPFSVELAEADTVLDTVQKK